MTPWEIQADQFTNCNCAYGCPCQFNALPTYGNCAAISGYDIKKGHFGDVKLDGLRVATAFWWPGPVHEGGGKAFIIIDEDADDDQRAALLSILSGENTEPGTTFWNVFAATFDKVFEPEFKPIEVEIDVDARQALVKVEGLIEITGEPIKNPVTGDEHRARINLPNGFEYSVAEMGSASGVSRGPVALEFKDTYGQFAHIHLSNEGVIHP
jgi:hypothetical protein